MGNPEEIKNQKEELLKNIANQKQEKGGNADKGKEKKAKTMFKDKRLNIIVNKIGLSEQDANWCISIHKKYCIWIANILKTNPDLKRREGDINLILDWKKDEQELNLNDFTFEKALETAREAHGMTFKENDNSLKNKNIVLDLGKFKWVQLITMADCKEEGDAMGHCIGGNGHSDSIAKGKTIAFSLRDEFNRPHITLEAHKINGTVFEFKGRSNGVPKHEYMECYIELARKYADTLGVVTDYTFIQGISKDLLLAQRINFVNKRAIDNRTKLSLGLDMFNKGETFMQSIQVGNELKKFELPEEIKIYGNLFIAILGEIVIPKDIVIGGSVSIVGKSLILGDNIKIGGNFEAVSCEFKNIPNGLMVCGDVVLPKSLEKKEKEVREKITFGGRLIFGELSDESVKMRKQMIQRNQELQDDYEEEDYEEEEYEGEDD